MLTQDNEITARISVLLLFSDHAVETPEPYKLARYPTASQHHECKVLSWKSRRLDLTKIQIVEWAFGRRMTPAERLRKHQRALEKTQRELDRERVKLENQEKKLVADIKVSHIARA